MSAPLYNARILRLAASIPHHAPLADAMAVAENRSSVCGSRVKVAVRVNADGRLEALGLDVSACALGQASAALMASHAIGRRGEELAAARDALTAWLAGEGALPDWPEIELFDAARAHVARHASIRLPFEAVAAAVAQACAAPVEAR
ncbi:iron-sulfur cluster assembly scaffold protein [Sphingomonas sp. SFZ2018-12]|uniref:iron-sulfur cluster assembly scaffold protein n=1 Tax=Sphingomonas sp. SFZ2018-12 TaxID=2683197 RepID=UPI001F10504F|nr:iron-sulfur cluster assembly scaffold protein [Sphingomonas sp. SFZ2018-12]MCH4892953.1 iron-sulfur cluster assembly scaffold protein [Sphingomonas sp. SFZ2018-12]